MSSLQKLTVSDIISILEEGDDILDPTIFLEPPENATMSDGDSDEEEPSCDINRFSGNQLRAGGELIGRRITEDGLQEVRYGNEADVNNDKSVNIEEEITEGGTLEVECLGVDTTPSVISNKKQNDDYNQKGNEASTKIVKRKEYDEQIHPSVSKKSKKVEKQRSWENKDILDKSALEFTRAMFLDNDYSPVELFQFFFDDDVVDYIVACTNQYAHETGNMSFTTTRDELRLFFAILFLSGYNVVSRTRMYWELAEDVHNEAVAKAMSRNRFDDMMKYLHFCENSKLDKNDKFGKIRPVMCMLNERWIQYFPGDAFLSVDESMVPYFGRYGAKQHIHGKPIRFGYKIWILATRLGYAVQGEPYQGKGSGTKNPELGVGGSVVLDLVSKLPQDRKYSLFFDNFFTSFRLLEELKRKGYEGTGTVRKDRVEKAPLIDPKVLQKKTRGSYHQITDKETNITFVRYHDNSVFTIASTASGVQPTGQAKRWSSSEKKHILVDQPSCVALYNTNMGGVDRLDENIASYRINIRNKKWYWPMIAYLLNVSMNNAWLLYRLTTRGIEEKLDLLGFTRYVVRTYLSTCSIKRPSAGRPSTSVASRVLPEIRFDGMSHNLVTVEKQLRCGQCKKATRKKCKKCNVGCHILCAESFHKR